MNKKKTKKMNNNTLALNKKARHDFFIEQSFEAGLSLEGWEVKAIKARRVSLVETYVKIIKNEALLLGCNINPLPTTSTHKKIDPTRIRKLLLHRAEINKLIGYVERQGYTLVALSLYDKKGRIKLEVGLAKGKKQHDKRATSKDRDWKRTQERLRKRS